MEKPPNKGKYSDVCFRAVCNNEPALWYNHSTRMYYCDECAMIINRENKRDAMRIFGHDLCTLDDHNKQRIMNITIDDEPPIPDDPNAPWPYQWSEPADKYDAAFNGCAKCLAIMVASAVTLGLIIYLALTWRS